MTPDEIRKIIDSFPNDSKRHHHALIRELADQLLRSRFEAILLVNQVQDLRAELAKSKRRNPQLEPCEEDVA